MSTQGSRLKTIRNTLGMSQTDFAKYLSISRTAVTKVEGNFGNFSIENYVKLVKKINVNLNYLIANEGEMFIAENKSLLNQLEKEGIEVGSDKVLRKK